MDPAVRLHPPIFARMCRRRVLSTCVATSCCIKGPEDGGSAHTQRHRARILYREERAHHQDSYVCTRADPAATTPR